MFRYLHQLVALFSIALVAIDGFVGAHGHSHEQHASDSVAVSECHHDHGGCHHHHHAEAPQSPQPTSSPIDSEKGPHDDCALCRHFSQPVAPATVQIALVGSERVEPFVLLFVARSGAIVTVEHAARGPPAIFA